MRVGIVCPYDLSKPGGVQAQVLGLAWELNRTADEVKVIGPGLPEDIPGIDLGRTITIPGNGSKVPISADPTVRRIMKSVAKDIDVLHVHEPLMPSVSLSALRVGNPVVATFHAAPGDLGTRFYNLVGFALQRILGPNTRAVTAVSETAKKPLPEELEVSIIPNAIDVASFNLDVERDPRLVVFLGRDEPRKGLDTLLDAWPLVLESAPDARLAVMGADRGTEGVEWLGRVDDDEKTRVLNEAAVYVAPNTGGESFGIVLLEAMAAGAAVVASDIPAFRDVGGDAARYFGVGDSAGLASLISRVLGDDDERAAMSRQGLARVGDYDWDTVVTLYRDTYASVLS